MVTVVMTTYDDGRGIRYGYAKRCYDAWCAYTHNPWIASQRILLADDGSPNVRQLAEWEMWHTTGPHNGIGASLNRALAQVEGPWIYTTDDWLLTDKLDLTLPLWLLTQGYDYVRLGPIHPNLCGVVKFTHPYGWWLDLTHGEYGCDEGFYYATRPFLASQRFIETVGPFAEGVDAYVMETDFNKRALSHWYLKAAAINLAGPWEHIGEYEVGNLPVLAGV